METNQSLNIHIQLARLYHQRGSVDYTDSLGEHAAIVEAFRARHPEGASRAVENHIQSVEMRLCEMLETEDF